MPLSAPVSVPERSVGGKRSTVAPQPWDGAGSDNSVRRARPAFASHLDHNEPFQRAKRIAVSTWQDEDDAADLAVASPAAPDPHPARQARNAVQPVDNVEVVRARPAFQMPHVPVLAAPARRIQVHAFRAEPEAEADMAPVLPAPVTAARRTSRNAVAPGTPELAPTTVRTAFAADDDSDSDVIDTGEVVPAVDADPSYLQWTPALTALHPYADVLRRLAGRERSTCTMHPPHGPAAPLVLEPQAQSDAVYVLLQRDGAADTRAGDLEAHIQQLQHGDAAPALAGLTALARDSRMRRRLHDSQAPAVLVAYLRGVCAGMGVDLVVDGSVPAIPVANASLQQQLHGHCVAVIGVLFNLLFDERSRAALAELQIIDLLSQLLVQSQDSAVLEVRVCVRVGCGDGHRWGSACWASLHRTARCTGARSARSTWSQHFCSSAPRPPSPPSPTWPVHFNRACAGTHQPQWRRCGAWPATIGRTATRSRCWAG